MNNEKHSNSFSIRTNPMNIPSNNFANFTATNLEPSAPSKIIPSSIIKCTESNARPYRQRTTELLKKLESLTSSKPAAKNARDHASREVFKTSRPKSRNVVLLDTADLIWKIITDEMVRHFSTLESIRYPIRVEL